MSRYLDYQEQVKQVYNRARGVWGRWEQQGSRLWLFSPVRWKIRGAWKYTDIEL